MMDDLCAVSTCGVETVKTNSYINYKISSKKLQCGAQKCKRMHIGSTQNPLICSELMIDGWKEENVTFVETGKSQRKDTY